MRVYFINLDRSSDRRDEFLRVNRHLTEAVRCPAVDGRSVDMASIIGRGLVSADILTAYNPGALGGALSHGALWALAARGDEPLTCCEDDAIFHRDFEARGKEVLHSLPDGWDFILWGWNFDLYLMFEMLPGVSYALAQFEQDRMRQATDRFQNQAVSPRAFKLLWGFGIPCYTVSPKGARTLLDRLLPFRPMTISVAGGERAAPHTAHFKVLAADGALNSVYRDINAYVCFPPLVVSKNVLASSTIWAGD